MSYLNNLSIHSEEALVHQAVSGPFKTRAMQPNQCFKFEARIYRLEAPAREPDNNYLPNELSERASSESLECSAQTWEWKFAKLSGVCFLVFVKVCPHPVHVEQRGTIQRTLDS